MPINIPGLRQAIREGAEAYLTETKFSPGMFAVHGDIGQQRATKVKQLLDIFDRTSGTITPADDELRVLALADAIFMPIVFAGGPTLRNFIYEKLKQYNVFTFNDAWAQNFFRKGFHYNHEYCVPTTMFPVGTNIVDTDISRFLADKIQAVIKAKTNSVGNEPEEFRTLRANNLNKHSAVINIDLFTSHSKAIQNERVRSLLESSNTCAIL